ncbi:MAG: ABC transporter permease [Deltaproteobacteria bacterium]|nr:ABC transporter permease [Deltaproteobacteria bacterium]
MTLRDIALLNLRRRKAKAGFVLAGLLIGVSTVVALISLVTAITEDINHKLEQYGANILVVPKTENLSLSYGGLSLGGVSFEMQELRQEDLKKVFKIPNAGNVAALGPVVLGPVEISSKKVLLAGVDFRATKVLKPWWKVQGTVPEGKGVILGSEAARVLGARGGSTLTLGGWDVPVTGVLEATGSQDDSLVFTDVGTAQFLLDKPGRVSMAEVAAMCKDCPIEDMVKQISAVLPGANVMAIQQVVKGRMETLAHFKKFSYGISAVVILVGSLVVLVTMMGSVRERTGEIGIFRAIGFRKSHVIRIVLLEAGIVSALAGVLGYFGGLGATKALLPFFAEGGHAGHGASVPFDPALGLGALALSIVLGLAASAYPALIAARLDPNEALRSL